MSEETDKIQSLEWYVESVRPQWTQETTYETILEEAKERRSEDAAAAVNGLLEREKALHRETRGVFLRLEGADEHDDQAGPRYTVAELREKAREWDQKTMYHGQGSPVISELVFLDWLDSRGKGSAE